ncbi:MAG: formate dehydrogenase accessory sulfurtransferase FdhD [Reichenbachiella sp.]|uniref:formate dehydrogenase accessory sulfurtransferase FdhD n=1 Tax=Reichenbachiella sp. TaxID=2184521 RepID=UPI003262CD1B
MSTIGITTSKILRIGAAGHEETKDLLVREEPLEIRVGYGAATQRREFPLAVTMRTPGADEELARGFLLSEGIVSHPKDILSAKYCLQAKQPENTLKVELVNDLPFEPDKFKRNFYASSSCGVCGKAALEAITCELPKHKSPSFKIKKATILGLSDQVKEHQSTFKYTGGLHAAALFDQNGALLIVREDIGRHNALDKLIGVGSMQQMDWSDKTLWLSGRLGFEMVQKPAVIGLRTIVGLGAPSSLAIDLAKEAGLTLVGFLKKDSFNIYSGIENVNLTEY